MVADILSEVNIGSVGVTTTGSEQDMTRITRKSVYVQISTASGAELNIDSSINGTDWSTIDSKTYASGTDLQSDIFSYNSHLPFMRTVFTLGSNLATASTTITGRGV